MDEQQYLREREEKQIYLRTNIIEKGHDPNQFSEFLQTFRGNKYSTNKKRRWR